MLKIRLTIVFLLLIGIMISGCITEQPKTDTSSKSVSEKEVWYGFGDLVTPGFYFNKENKELTLKSVNSVIGTVADGLKSLIPGYGEASFKNSWEKLLNSVDSSMSAGWVESMFITAQGNCIIPEMKLSDTGENMGLPDVLKHFGNLYGDNDPNTNPTLEDLEFVKAKVNCYNHEFSNTNTKETPEQRYFLDLTTDIEKLIDTKIAQIKTNSKAIKTEVTAESEQNQLSSEQLRKTIAEEVSVTSNIDEKGVLRYDNGERDSAGSLGPKGHAVLFSNDKKLKISGIKIYGSRYDDFSRKFDVEIWDSNFKTLYSKTYDYQNQFPDSGVLVKGRDLKDSDFKWVKFDIPDLEVNGNFYVTLFTYSGPPSWENIPRAPKGGIYVGVDSDTKSGHSFVVDKNPNRILDWPTTWPLRQDSTDWMIRVLI